MHTFSHLSAPIYLISYIPAKATGLITDHFNSHMQIMDCTEICSMSRKFQSTTNDPTSFLWVHTFSCKTRRRVGCGFHFFHFQFSPKLIFLYTHKLSREPTSFFDRSIPKQIPVATGKRQGVCCFECVEEAFQNT
jgi:hypothetical protein